MLEVEVVGEAPPKGAGCSRPSREHSYDIPSHAEIERLCTLAVASAGIESGHIAVEFVSAERIARLNAEYRGNEGPTDVLSFPIDGVGPIDRAAPAAGAVPAAGVGPRRGASLASPAGSGSSPPRELGDIVICPEHTADVREAIVHGTLHLLGMDHETDDGEMLALQNQLMCAANAKVDESC